MASTPASCLWPFDPLGPLARRIEGLGYPVTRVESASGRNALLVDRGGAHRAAVIPVGWAERDLRSELRNLRDLAPSRPLTTLAYGGRPDATARSLLTQAGVLQGLFEPLDERVLRFQMNRALAPAAPAPRAAVRAPVDLQVDARWRMRRSPERLYTLSSSGAFLLTDTPLAPGRRITLRIPVGMLRPQVHGRVVLANRPDDPQVPELPPGMAIAFGALDGPSAAVIDRLVAESLDGLAIRPARAA